MGTALDAFDVQQVRYLGRWCTGDVGAVRRRRELVIRIVEGNTAARTKARRGEGDKTRESIIDSAETLMVEAGSVDAVSMRAIANAVGVTPPAIYAHFADKDELFGAICERRFAQLNEALEVMDRYDDPLEGLVAGGRAYVRFGLDNPEAYRFLMATKTEDDRSDTWTTEEPTQGDLAFMSLVNKVGQCVEAGALRQMDPLEAALILWAGVHGLVMLIITQPNYAWPEDLTDKLLEAAMYGLTPR